MATIQNVKSELRQPRGIVRINGEKMPGWIEWEVENNRFADADTFTVSFAMGALPKGRDDYWFASQKSLLVEIFAGFPVDPSNYDVGSMGDALIVGYADDPELDYGHQEIRLRGRDLTAKLIDSQTTMQWTNKTASDIAKIVAAKYGLTTTFVTQTKAKYGNFTELDNIGLSSQSSDWDLLVKLAELEQMSVYISGYDLHFEYLPYDTSAPYLMKWGTAPFTFNGTTLRVTRQLPLANGVQVTVNSFHQRVGKVAAKYPPVVGADAVQYVRRFPNLKPEQAMAQAKAFYFSIMQHELNLYAELPADNLLTIITPIKLEGTAYDQIYYPDVITRRMSEHDGYVMTAKAKNVSVANAGA